MSARRPSANRPLAIAAWLSFATLLVHVGFGTPQILDPVLQSDAPAVARETMRACWHLITLTLLAMTGSFAYGWGRRKPALILTWTLLAAGFGTVFVVVAVRSGLGFEAVPQSIAFFAIAISSAAGLHQSLYLPAEPLLPAPSAWARQRANEARVS